MGPCLRRRSCRGTTEVPVAWLHVSCSPSSLSTVPEVGCQVVSSLSKVDHARLFGGSAVVLRVSVRRRWPVHREVMLAVRRKRRDALPACACLTYSSLHFTQRSSLAPVRCCPAVFSGNPTRIYLCLCPQCFPWQQQKEVLSIEVSVWARLSASCDQSISS